MNPLAHADSSDSSKAERVYETLRRRIRELDLPPGAPVRKEEVALELGVSRAPVSEAIARLASEGLLEVFPQHGTFVTPIRVTDLREGLFLRTALEVEAARRAASVMRADLADELRDNIDRQRVALDGGDLVAFYDLDEAMHAIIFEEVSGNRTLKLLDSLRAPLDRVRRLILPSPGRAEATFAEHRQLVEAIISGDGEYAAAAMRAHLTAFARTIEERLSEIEGQSGDIRS